MSALHHTKGIVMRTVKYGETSIVASIFTELFGVQQYMVNGVRSSKKGNAMSASLFQPGNHLDMVVYQNERSSMQRIKESRQGIRFNDLFSDVTKNAVLLFMVELLQKCIKQPDPHPELFQFLEDVLHGLDKATPYQTANIPVFFTFHLTHFFGLRLSDDYSETNVVLDLQEGSFIPAPPMHVHFVEKPHSECIAFILRILSVEDLDQIKLNREIRNELLDAGMQFFALHVPPFGVMRSLPVLRTLMED